MPGRTTRRGRRLTVPTGSDNFRWLRRTPGPDPFPNGVVSVERKPLVRRQLILVALLVSTVACATRSAGDEQMAAVAPMLSVERFLQATNARDLDAMARLFGTASGPVADTGSTLGCAFKKMGSWIGLGRACATRVQVELRMDAIAQILRHEDYRIVSESQVAGRSDPTRRIGVNLTFTDTTVSDVPFVVVQSSEGRWLVEQIDLERVTQR